MRVITDFHLHSKYSRACSKELTLPHIAKACERKGIQLVGTSDMTHPAWRAHMGELLQPVEGNAYMLKTGESLTRFLLSTELSCIYKRGGKVRRVHHIVLCSSFEGLDRLIAALEKRGCNLKADGRPILGIDSEELIKILLEADANALLIPAHAWTPWFAVFGSASGFDSLEECFGTMTGHIHAIETGLSSDPRMNRRLSGLDNVFLVSNSDAHSLDKLGREANVFEMTNPGFDELRSIFVNKKKEQFIETIEFFPEEGKYHTDGHRACGFSCEPKETKRRRGICPVCGKPLTIGVLHRVDDLADREEMSKDSPVYVPYRYIIPLAELVGSVLGVGPSSKKVKATVDRMLEGNRTEFGILLETACDELGRIAPKEIAEAIVSMRNGEVDRVPGFDGEYGRITVRMNKPTQSSLLS